MSKASFSTVLSNNSAIIGHSRNISTSPKKIKLKDQIIQQISTIMSLELNKIDTRDIQTKLSIYFNINENDDANSYIKSLCANIADTKNSTISKVKNFLNHNINALIENSMENNSNENYSMYNNGDFDSMKNKYKSILKEVKVLNNNSRVKFKKLYDTLSNEYDKILSTMYDYLQKNNTKLIIDRLNRIEQIKNDILFDVTSIENLQNKFTDSVKNIINKEHLKQNEKSSNLELKKATNSLGRIKSGKHGIKKRNNNLANSTSPLSLNNYLTQSENDIFNKTYNSRFETSLYNNNDENERIKLYRIKIKDKKNEIEKLKQLLQQEKESKNKALNELNKLQYSNKFSLSLKNSQKNSSNIEKFNKLTEMIIGFTYSMNNLRNNLYQKTISHMDAKNYYGKLKMKLMSLIEEVYTLKNNLTNENNNNEKKSNFLTDLNNNENDEDINENNDNDIKTIKEENESSQILTERTERDKDSGNINIHSSTNSNQTGNKDNNNVTVSSFPNYNIDALLEENKKLRTQLAEKMINYSNELNSNRNNVNNNNENNNNQKDNKNESISNICNSCEILKKQIIELKKIILEKDQEIDEIRNNYLKNQKDELNNVIKNNTKNLEQLKTVYQLLIDGKDNRIKELEEEIISYEKEIELLKDENNNLKSECRKDKILSEAEVNNLKNQKIELQCLLEQGAGGSSNTLLNMTSLTANDSYDKERVIKLENEIKIKNKQILLLTQNHDNDLKELNLAIEMLKQKISQLEEENNSLSARNRNENNKNE